MTNTSLRPPEVAARIVPGHWEGDLIKGAMNRSSVGTPIERTSRYTMLVKLGGNTAQAVLDGFKRRLKSVPVSLRKTTAWCASSCPKEWTSAKSASSNSPTSNNS